MTTNETFSLFNAIPSGILVVDKDLRIVSWNDLLEEWTGLSHVDVGGVFLFDQFPTLAGGDFASRLKEALDYKICVYVSERLNEYALPIPIGAASDDRMMLQATQISPIEDDGNVYAVITIIDEKKHRERVGILRGERTDLRVAREQMNLHLEKLKRARAASLNMMEDAREREQELASVNKELIDTAAKLAEQQSRLQQAQKMEAVGTLAGGIAHDFNNLLGVILGYNELAQREAPQESKLNAHLSHIHTAGSRARDLVKQILDFSRHGDNKPKPVPIEEIIRNVISDLEVTLNKNIGIQYHYDGEIGCVMGDRTEIYGIALNLFNNAVQAMEENGGTLLIDLDLVDVSSKFANEHLVLSGRKYVRLTVCDAGCGIDEEHIKRIFEPFFTTKRIGQGTGLGLATVHGCVKKMSGAISVHSVKGIGTTFHIYLPQTDELHRLKPATNRTTQGSGQRIMVVDDEELLVTMCSAMLTQLGYTVTSSSESTEALAKFATCPNDFDLVVTDQRMPDLTGSELTAEIHKIRPDIPVILVTGYSEEICRENAASFGFSDFLSKPYTKNILSESITRIFAAEAETAKQS
ncbi:response regulator [bacterium AH-315-F03]|nr:response regulator [bacterium AH-315-F03]